MRLTKLKELENYNQEQDIMINAFFYKLGLFVEPTNDTTHPYLKITLKFAPWKKKIIKNIQVFSNEFFSTNNLKNLILEIINKTLNGRFHMLLSHMQNHIYKELS